MKEAGQVPVRFLTQVWKLVSDNRGDVKTGYRPMIKAEPTGVEEIVRHVMPQNRAGIDALTITNYLKKPSWVLLSYILSGVEGYGTDVAETTVATLRKTFALLPDSEQSCRATMYDPVQEIIKNSPANLSDSLKQQVWSGLESFLQQSESIKEDGKPDDLADAWINLSKLAMNEQRYQTGLCCAQRSYAHATGKHKVDALYQIAYCLHDKPEKECDKVIACYREILEQFTGGKNASEHGKTLSYLAWCLHCEHSKAQPEWNEAITLYRQALDLFAAPEQVADRANTLRQIAYCLHNKPQPEWNEAITFYRQALDLLTAPEQSIDRARILKQIGYCLSNKPQPEWNEAITFYRQALDLLTAPEQAVDRARTLYQIGYCLSNKPQPEWNEAITFYRQALDLLTSPEQSIDRARTLYQIGYCLSNKPQPEWDEAIAHYRQALDLRTAPEQADDRARTLYQIGYCLSNKPQPEWDEAIAHYRQALNLRTAPEQADDRASTLFRIGYCLSNKPQPEWDESIALYREALELLTPTGQTISQASILHPAYTIGFIIALDGKGLCDEADAWARLLEKSRLVEGEVTQDDIPLITLRQVFLALRSNNIETALSLAKELQGTTEYPRAMLLASIAYFAVDRKNEASQAITTSCSTEANVAWARAIAIGYFKHYYPNKLAEYLALLPS